MPDQNYTVERKEDDFGGRYFIRLAADAEAEMTYRRTGDHVIAVDHTFTPPAFRGRNIAQQLMEKLVADMGEEGTKVYPLCSFAVVQFRRHPEWSGLLAE